MNLSDRHLAIGALCLAAAALAAAVYSAAELERVSLERARASRLLAEELGRIEKIANDAHWGPLGVPVRVRVRRKPPRKAAAPKSR